MKKKTVSNLLEAQIKSGIEKYEVCRVIATLFVCKVR